MILSRNILKRVGESRHPCRTPTVVWNQSVMLLLKRTALVALSKWFLMTWIRFVLMLYCFVVAHKAACHTLSNCPLTDTVLNCPKMQRMTTPSFAEKWRLQYNY